MGPGPNPCKMAGIKSSFVPDTTRRHKKKSATKDLGEQGQN